MDIIESITILIEHGANVNSTSQNGKTPLYCAVEYNHKEAITILIGCNANVNSADKDGITPLHYAVEYDCKEAITSLIGCNANVNSTDKDGNTPLHYAAVNGNTEAIIALVNNGAIIDSTIASSTTHKQEIVNILKAGLLIDKLYNGIPDFQANYAELNISKVLPRLEFLIKTKGLPLHLFNPNNIPEPIRSQVIKLIEPFKNIDQNIQDAVEIHSAAILYKLYPEQFLSPLPYSKILEHKDHSANPEVYNKLLESYEQNPENKPVNFFYSMLNLPYRNTIIDKLISYYQETMNMLSSLDNAVLTQF